MSLALSESHDFYGIPELETRVCSAVEWDANLAAFDDVRLDQSRAFIALRWCHWPTGSIEFRCDEELLGGAAFTIFSVPGIGAVAYVKFGPVWRTKHEKADPLDYRDVLSALVYELALKRNMGIIIVPRPQSESLPIETRILLELGFRRRPCRSHRCRLLLDTSLTDDEQRRSLAPRWRLRLHESLKIRLAVRAVTVETAIRDFSPLWRSRPANGFFAGSTLDALRLLGDLPDTLRPLMFVALAEDEPIAGAAIAVHDVEASYLFGCASAAAGALNAEYHLHWEIFRDLRSRKVELLDLGDGGDKRAREFKEGLAGNRGLRLALPDEYEYARGLAGWASLRAMSLARSWSRILA